jgi:hypothetical protein
MARIEGLKISKKFKEKYSIKDLKDIINFYEFAEKRIYLKSKILKEHIPPANYKSGQLADWIIKNSPEIIDGLVKFFKKYN